MQLELGLTDGSSRNIICIRMTIDVQLAPDFVTATRRYWPDATTPLVNGDLRAGAQLPAASVSALR
jgi:hypothetical protein